MVSISIFICGAFVFGSIFVLLQEINQYAKGAEAYSELSAQVEQNVIEGTPQDGMSNLLSVNFDELERINPDIGAWIYSEGTSINYPVVQGSDNDYYLNHLFTGEKNKLGCLFFDYENHPFTDRNTIIYGHNMLDGSMFSELINYQNQDYYDEHKTLMLATPDVSYIFEIFSAYTANPSEVGDITSPWLLEWGNDTVYSEWILAAKTRSVIQSDTTVDSNDRVLTLSTCINFGVDRFIVVGKLVAVA